MRFEAAVVVILWIVLRVGDILPTLVPLLIAAVECVPKKLIDFFDKNTLTSVNR